MDEYRKQFHPAVKPYPHSRLRQPFASFENAQLPRLPIPPLEDTLQRYLDFVEPLLSREAMENTRKVVADFQEGEGPVLQDELVKLDKESPTSYLEGFWDSWYLEPRDPLIINVNPAFIFRRDTQKTPQVNASDMNFQIAYLIYPDRKGSAVGAFSADFLRQSPARAVGA